MLIEDGDEMYEFVDEEVERVYEIGDDADSCEEAWERLIEYGQSL